MHVKSPVLCLCNFGLVRSKTMANCLKRWGVAAKAVGMLNNQPVVLHHLMQEAGSILICNKINVDENFCREKGVTPSHAAAIKEVLGWHKNKIINVDTIGRDKWARENHPELMEICTDWLKRKD